MSKNALLLLSALVVIAFLACGVYKRPVKTYATNISYGYSYYLRQNMSRWEFYDYHGKECDDITSLEGESNDVVGEKFVLTYDSLHPRRYPLIDFSKPVFLPEEIKEKTLCVIQTSTTISQRAKYINFYHIAHGREYNGTQYILPIKDSVLEFKKGDKFEGECWKKNPKRVIIYIDKPVKGGIAATTQSLKNSDNWYKFEAKKFGFKIDFPKQPKTMEWEIDTALGFFYKSTQFLYSPKEKKDDNIYWVLFTEYPDSLYNSDNLNKDSLQSLYQKAIDGELKRLVDSKILSETPFALKGYSGKEVKIDFQENSRIINMRIFLAKNNLYMIGVSSDPKNDYNPSIKRFFDSFDLLYL